MYINLNDKDIKVIKEKNYGEQVLFSYQGKKYFFKKPKLSLDNIYNELIACRIAKQMNIPCCEYYPAEYYNSVGVASEYFEDDKAILMEDYLRSKFGKDIHVHNNIMDIRDCFFMDFDEETANRLTNDLINIFIFDAIIGNADRNSTNYMLIIDGKNTRFAPLFDNENMLDEHAIYYGDYSLGLDERDYYDGERFNILYKFLDWADEDVYSRFLEALKLIDDENIEAIFEEIGKDTMVVGPIKEKVIKRLHTNKTMIDKYLNNKKKKTCKEKSKKVCYN